MAKLVLQVGVAVVIWLGLGVFEVHWGIRIAAILLGAICVHQIWERVVFRPYDYLGAVRVSDDDPIMQGAIQRARETFNEFRELYPAPPSV